MEDNLRDLLEAVNFIKDRMATKDDVAALQNRLDKLDANVGRVDTKIAKFEESEIDKRLQLDVRVQSLEKHLGLDTAIRS
jgi:hypothetical protein